APAGSGVPSRTAVGAGLAPVGAADCGMRGPAPWATASASPAVMRTSRPIARAIGRGRRRLGELKTRPSRSLPQVAFSDRQRLERLTNGWRPWFDLDTGLAPRPP